MLQLEGMTVGNEDGLLLVVPKERAMASLKQIVLVDTFGEELFSGKSLFSDPPPENDVEDIEACPETLRSSVFVRAYDHIVEHKIEVTIDGFYDLRDDGGRAA